MNNTIEEYYTEALRRYRYCDTKKNLVCKFTDGNLRMKEGEVAGSISSNGYWTVSISINKKVKRLLSHRVILLELNGSTPNWSDHIDRNKLNNDKRNLRSTSPQENNQNRSKSEESTSKYLGVASNGSIPERWVSVVCLNGEYYRHSFDKETDAALMADSLKRKLHKTPVLNFPEENHTIEELEKRTVKHQSRAPRRKSSKIPEGMRNIRQSRKGEWQVRVQRKGLRVIEKFKTLEEAQNFRDGKMS